MTLRRKTFLIIVLTLFCSITVLYGVSKSILLDGFARLEKATAGQNINRALNSVSELLRDLDRRTVDWAIRDETYGFAGDNNLNYIGTNLTAATFLSLQINLVMFINSSGQIVFAKCFDLNKKEAIPVPEELKKSVNAGSPLLRHRPDPKDRITGIVLLTEGPMLVASSPVLTTQGKGPVRGTLVMGRYLDAAEIDRLGKVTGLSLTLYRFDDAKMPSDFRAALASLTPDVRYISRPLNEKRTAGYTLIKDIFGRPALIMRVDMPRDIYMQGIASLRYLIYILFAAGLAAGIGIFLIADKLVLTRLSRLSAEVNNIGARGDLSVRVSTAGDDELSSLASAINRTLAVLEESQRNLQENEKLFKILSISSPTGIYIVQDGKLKFVNPLFERLSGYSQNELLGMDSLELVVPEDKEAVRENAVSMLKGQRSLPYEFRLATKNGEIRWMMGTISSILYQGKIAALGNCIDITEYKRVEGALRESEALYRTTFENTGTALTIIEEDTTLSLVNTEFEKLSGYSKEELEGKKSWTEFVGGDDLERMREYHYRRRMDPNGAPREYEFTFINREGKPIDVLITIAIIPGTKRSIASLLDITERKKAEEALRENESRLRQIADNMLDLISRTDDKGLFRYVSPSHRNVLGYEPEEMLGKSIYDLIHPDDIAGALEIFREAARSHSGARFEVRTRHADGHYVWLEVVGKRLLDSEDQVVGAIFGARDVTERKQVEEQLREAKALLEGVLDAIPDAVGIQDPEHHIIRLNRAGYQLLNLTPEQVKGKKCYELIGRTSRCRPCATERAWRTKRLERVEKYVPELGLYLDCRSNPILDENGDIQMVVEQFYDVTERRRVEEQLRYLTLHDSLTGLYNRAYFEEEMRRLGSGRHAPIGIIVCDVDGLKLVNDTLGHDAGDRLLTAAANVIRGSFRPDDMVARIGGDEFAILLPKSDRNAVEGACQRIRDAVSRYNDEQPDIPLSISAGFAFSEDTRLNIVELFKEADNNMYREKLHRSQSARSVVVQTLMHMLEERDFGTEGHVDRLQNLVVRLAGAVGLPEHRINDLRLLALFHDIGKVGVSDRILLKPGPLTPEERAEMQRHCEVGHRIAQSIPDLPPIASWILKHHEWWNGKGYPLGLKGEEIPLECRILAIADAYDAMTHDRPYRKAMTREEALAELKRCAGTQFDSDLVEKFVQIIEEESERA